MSRFALIGHPVAHSVSPAIHGAAYRELGLAHEYILVDAPDAAAVERVVDDLKAGKLAGVNVTVPHKRLALSLATSVDPVCERIGAANVLAPDAGGVRAYNTDAGALAAALKARVPNPRGACILGSGGAALAAAAACQAIGVAAPVVVARSWQADIDPQTWRRSQEFRALGAHCQAWPASGADLGPALEGCQIIVQATSAGMHGIGGGEELSALVPWERLDSRTLAYDLIYNPPVTPFMAAAKAAGLLVEGGLGMLVGQAALAIEIWLGVKVPHPPLRQAAEQALGLGSLGNALKGPA